MWLTRYTELFSLIGTLITIVFIVLHSWYCFCWLDIVFVIVALLYCAQPLYKMFFFYNIIIYFFVVKRIVIIYKMRLTPRYFLQLLSFLKLI